MCFGSGAPKYKKPDFGPLPSLYVDPNTKSTVKPVGREEEASSSSSGGGEVIATRSGATRTSGPAIGGRARSAPPTRGRGSSLFSRSRESVREAFGVGRG